MTQIHIHMKVLAVPAHIPNMNLISFLSSSLTRKDLKMNPFTIIPLLFHFTTSSPLQYYNHYQPNHLYNHNHPHHAPSTSISTTTYSSSGNANRRVFEALFSPYVTAASVVPKFFSDDPFWIPHAYFNLCDTVDQTDDSLWAYGCSPGGPGPNSQRQYANIPRPTYPYETVDDKGSGVLTVPMPDVPEHDYYAAFWMQQANAMGSSTGGSNWGFWNNLPQGFYG